MNEYPGTDVFVRGSIDGCDSTQKSTSCPIIINSRGITRVRRVQIQQRDGNVVKTYCANANGRWRKGGC